MFRNNSADGLTGTPEKGPKPVTTIFGGSIFGANTKLSTQKDGYILDWPSQPSSEMAVDSSIHALLGSTIAHEIGGGATATLSTILHLEPTTISTRTLWIRIRTPFLLRGEQSKSMATPHITHGHSIG